MRHRRHAGGGRPPWRDGAGADIALRWLVVAQRRLRDAGVPATLVAGDGAVLPFPAESFDVATSMEVLETHATSEASSTP